MSRTYISADLRRLVEERAGQCCEYCLLPADVSFFPHEVDHIVAEKHGGLTEEHNLAFACWRCNRHKGTDLASLDPMTGTIAMLFNPRIHPWAEHFIITGMVLEGRTPEGRTTARLLQFNTAERLAERQRLGDVGHYPPEFRPLD